MPGHRFGKHPPKRDYRTLRFKNYVKAGLAAPPSSFNVLTDVYGKLKTNDPTKLFPMDGNDQYGDCTIAALGHAITIYEGKVGKKHIMNTKEALKVYFHLSGGVDSGLNELDVLNYWRQTKVSTEKILAFASIDPKNHTHIQQAIQLLGGVYLGFQVQANCEQEFNARQPWTPGPLTRDGHAVLAVAYDQKELTVLTWGNTQQATWEWWDECVDEAYAILPQEATNPAYAGIDLAQLKQDLNEVANA